MYFWQPLLLIVGLTLVLMFASACSPQTHRAAPPQFGADASYTYYDPENPTINRELEAIRDKNFSVLRTEMVMKGMSMDNPMLIRAFKSEMQLELWVQSSYSPEYKLFKTYNICKKSGRLGPKLKEGDKQTPEGFYAVTPYRLNPNSKYFLSFNIGYPNEYDKAHGRTGSHLMIHGECVSEGCLAMTNKNIGEIYLIVEQNFKYGHQEIPIHMYPFRMTEANLSAREDSYWYPFWRDMKKAYDYFERSRTPPDISVKNGRYVVEGHRLY